MLDLEIIEYLSTSNFLLECHFEVLKLVLNKYAGTTMKMYRLTTLFWTKRPEQKNLKAHNKDLEFWI